MNGPPDEKRAPFAAALTNTPKESLSRYRNARNAAQQAGAELPEHRNDRRRFIVWAVLAGYAAPARLTEAVLNEVVNSEEA